MPNYEYDVNVTWAGFAMSTGAVLSGNQDVVFPSETILNELAARWALYAENLASDQLVLRSIYIRRLEPLYPGVTFIPDGWPILGTGSTAQPMNLRDAANVNLTSVTAGLPFRNMIQLPGLTEEHCSAGLITNAHIAALYSWAESLLSTPIVNAPESYAHVMRSPKTGAVKAYTAHNIRPEVGKQSNRKRS